MLIWHGFDRRIRSIPLKIPPAWILWLFYRLASGTLITKIAQPHLLKCLGVSRKFLAAFPHKNTLAQAIYLQQAPYRFAAGQTVTALPDGRSDLLLTLDKRFGLSDQGAHLAMVSGEWFR